MADYKNLIVKFIGDTKHFDKKVNNVNKKITDSNDKSKKSFNSTTKATNNFASSIGSLATKIGIFTAAALAITKGLRAVISAGAQAEDAIVKLGVTMGSEQKGFLTYQKALKFSIITPFDPKDIVDAAVVASQYGADAFQKGLYGMKKDAMTVIADMAAFSNQSTEEAATALFRADLALLDKYGKSGRDAYRAAKKVGELGSAEFISTFVKQMSDVPLWMGMAEKKSQTMSGIWSTIKGNVGLIFTYLSGATEKGITFWTQLKSMLKSFSDWFGKVIDTLKPILTNIGTVFISVFRVVWDIVSLVYTVVAPIMKVYFAINYLFIKIITSTLKYVLIVISKILFYVGKVINLIYGFLFRITGLQSLFKWVSTQLPSWIVKITAMFAILKIGFNLFVEKLKGIFHPLKVSFQLFFLRIEYGFLRLRGLISSTAKKEAVRLGKLLDIMSMIEKKSTGKTRKSVATYLENNPEVVQMLKEKGMSQDVKEFLGTQNNITKTTINNKTTNNNSKINKKVTNVNLQASTQQNWMRNPFDLTGNPTLIYKLEG